jgi:putative hemolysin
MASTDTQEPFQLNFPVDEGTLRSKFLHALEPSLSRILCLPELNEVYAAIDEQARVNDFMGGILEAMNVSLDVDESDLERIPRQGPLVVVANHPFGALEGVALAALLRKARKDVKLMANYILAMIPEMREHIFCVDPFGRKSSTGRNLGALKQSMRWVRDGGCLAVFPAGEVSSLKLSKRQILDPEWSATIGRMVRMTRAPVLPIYFRGTNGPLFHILGLIHPRFRTALLPRELLNKKRGSVGARIGSTIPFSRLEGFSGDKDLTEYLRLRTYILKHRAGPVSRGPKAESRQALADAPPAERLLNEVRSLPERSRLFENEEYLVFSVRGADSPCVFKEIGRLREKCFREVGEGTGRPLDLDRFDEHYDHLILWSKQGERIAGGYRIGRLDDILERFGPRGLYTATLFTFKRGFLKRLSPALELGRAFVDTDFQKSYFPLLLLWKGIAAYIVRNPQYRVLFGPVSISNDYHPISRQLMMRFLAAQHGERLGKLLKPIKPKNPPRFKPKPPGGIRYSDIDALFRDIEDLSGAVSEIETDGKGIPVLIRQYLKLGGLVLTFNRDEDFGDAIDGLMLVDLARTPERILAKYMGKEETTAFKAFHSGAES